MTHKPIIKSYLFRQVLVLLVRITVHQVGHMATNSYLIKEKPI